MLYWVGGRARSPRSRPGGRPRRTGAPAFPVAGIVLAAAVAALGLWWLATHSTVTLVVDGRPSTHETHAGTVGDFLARAGVDVGTADEVVPAVSTQVRPGMRVEVVRAAGPRTGQDGRSVADAATVAELQSTAGPVTARGGETPRRLVRPSRVARARAGTPVERTPSLAVTLVHDGRTDEVVATDRTVADLLERLEVPVGPDDRVRPDPQTPVSDGLVVTVERVTTALEVREEPIAFETSEHPTGDLPRGERREVQAGRPGVVEITEEVVFVDGREASRAAVGERLVAEPVERVVEVGTADRSADPPDEPAPAVEDPAAAAEPTATPRPDAGDEDDEAPSSGVEEGDASWYDNPYGGFTAAHRTLPRGTVVRVTNVANGRSVDVRINDRGPFVEGRVIDLNREAFAELASPSRGVVGVRIEW